MNVTSIFALHTSSTRRTGKPRLLVAEDDCELRRFLQELLMPFYEVEAVADGELAWSAVQRTVPALLLTDLQMPNLDGLGLTQRVRAQPQLARLPIILLTACNDEELPLLGVAKGVNDILLKPFRCTELLACLQAAIVTHPSSKPAACRWQKRRGSLRRHLPTQTSVDPTYEPARFRTNPAYPRGR